MEDSLGDVLRYLQPSFNSSFIPLIPDVVHPRHHHHHLYSPLELRPSSVQTPIQTPVTRSLGCTIRAIAADTKLLLAGGIDGFIQCWTAVEGIPHLFDLKGCQSENAEFRLWEHEGPVTSLALDLTRIYSGSWDMTVRVWDRISLQCFMVLRHSDWVWSLAPHSATIASTSGSDVYIWDTVSGTLAAIIPRCHSGNTYALARSHTGDFLFTGGEDGAIHMFDISNFAEEEDVVKVATWIPHSGPVNSLAFEFPWLVSASNDGKLSLIVPPNLPRASISLPLCFNCREFDYDSN